LLAECALSLCTSSSAAKRSSLKSTEQLPVYDCLLSVVLSLLLDMQFYFPIVQDLVVPQMVGDQEAALTQAMDHAASYLEIEWDVAQKTTECFVSQTSLSNNPYGITK
ncbi:unnamed protein product, partial [Prunus brigantina]